MKKILIGFLLIISLDAFADTIKVQISGMSCGGCIPKIEQAFNNQKDVERVNVKFPEQLVTLTTRPGRSLDKKTINQLLNQAGYNVISVEVIQ